MTRPALALAAILLSSACSRQVQYARAPQVPPNPIRQTMERQILNALNAGEGDLEIQAMRQAVLANPANLDARTRLAERYAQMGFPEVAVEHYRLAASHHPDDPEVHVNLARQLRARDMGVEAAKLLDGFLARRADKLPEAHAWAGILHDELGQLAVGESQHRQAIRESEEPRDYLHNNLGYNLLLQGRSDEAAREFRLALDLAPRSEVARNNLGVAIAGNGLEAVKHWQSVGGPSTAHNNMAAVLIEQGRLAEARKEINIALGYRPDNPAALHNLALVSQLDGLPATLPLNHPPSFWRKFGMMFSGGRSQANPPAAQSAARQN
jgi:tetratricopeptide (TPR) repeat protein